MHEIKISAKEVKGEQCGGGDETATNCDTGLDYTAAGRIIGNSQTPALYCMELKKYKDILLIKNSGL